MKPFASPSLGHQPALSTEAARRQAVQFALRLAGNTPLAPSGYERRLLAQFVRGDLTIDQVLTCLEAGEGK